MTSAERIEAALSALPNVEPTHWSIAQGIPLTESNSYVMTAAPDLAAEVIRLRAELEVFKTDLLNTENDLADKTTLYQVWQKAAMYNADKYDEAKAELADSRQQVEMLERGVIATGCNNDQLRAELAELRRWRDPVTEPPLGDDDVLVNLSGVVSISHMESGITRYWAAFAIPEGWMPLPEAGE